MQREMFIIIQSLRQPGSQCGPPTDSGVLTLSISLLEWPPFHPVSLLLSPPLLRSLQTTPLY